MNTSQKPSKIKFEYEEDNELEGTATGSSILEEDSAMCDLDGSIIGADQTSADYYFDSYSHFGNSISVSPHSYLYSLELVPNCICFLFLCRYS